MSFLIRFARLQEDGLLFAGQCEVEAAALEELIGRRDRHHFKHMALPRSLYAGRHQSFADATSLLIG